MSHASEKQIPNPTLDEAHASKGERTAVFAGGCFWGVQAVFEHLRGVTRATAGYAGGSAETAHYQAVSTGTTGHAESVEVWYDPSKISYGTLLKIFFSVIHDPTQLNRQGPDTGTEYRSIIFFTDKEQEHIAKAYIKQLDEAKFFSKSIVTQVVPLKGFYPAEEYHQHFADQHPNNPYILVCDRPKMENLRKLFPTLYK